MKINTPCLLYPLYLRYLRCLLYLRYLLYLLYLLIDPNVGGGLINPKVVVMGAPVDLSKDR